MIIILKEHNKDPEVGAAKGTQEGLPLERQLSRLGELRPRDKE